jgi:hypothetical protein
MNIESISSAQTPPETRNSIDNSGQAVIDLQQIKSILYLGVKGKISVPAVESHRIDTFA